MATTTNIAVGGRTIVLSNLDKLIWPDAGVTKADLIHYVFMVSHRMLPHLRNRPLTVTRFPDGVEGEGFYQKDLPAYAPEWIETFPVLSDDGSKVTRYILPNETATLIWLANQAALEFHPWMSRADDPEHPDYVVIDLDPSAGASFNDVRRVARFVHETLAGLGLKSFPKLSGATGIHVYVPIAPRFGFKETSAFAGYIGELAVRALPQIATNERLVKNRGSKVYVDHLQNLPGKTIVCAYSPRPRPGARVSVPFAWDELDAIHPDQFAIGRVEALLARPDHFAGLYDMRQDLGAVLAHVTRRPARK